MKSFELKKSTLGTSYTSMEKLVLKECAKKIQGFSSMNKANDMCYFCSIIEPAEGNMDLLQIALKTMQKDKKCKDWGVFLLSSNENTLIGAAHVPMSLSLQKELDVKEWTREILSYLPHKNYGINMADEISSFEIIINPEEEIFPFKLCDEIYQKNIDFLKRKNIIPPCNDESENEGDYADEAGIEW